jgi:hypothetical protein
MVSGKNAKKLKNSTFLNNAKTKQTTLHQNSLANVG